MYKTKKLLSTILLSGFLTACGGSGSDSKSESTPVVITPEPVVTHTKPVVSFDGNLNVLEGESLTITPVISVDSGATYTVGWSVDNGDFIEYTSDQASLFVKSKAVNEDVTSTFTITVTDSNSLSTTVSFAVIINDELVATVAEAISNMERTGALPALDTTPTLQGIDDDDDGIRDDISLYIDTLQVNKEQKIALKDMAKGLQSKLLVDLSNEQAVNAVAEQSSLDAVCLVLQFDSGIELKRHVSKLESFTANTEERQKQYEKYNAARHGSVKRLPDFSACL